MTWPLAVRNNLECAPLKPFANFKIFFASIFSYIAALYSNHKSNIFFNNANLFFSN